MWLFHKEKGDLISLFWNSVCHSVTNFPSYWIPTRYKAFCKYPHNNLIIPCLQTKKGRLGKGKRELGSQAAVDAQLELEPRAARSVALPLPAHFHSRPPGGCRVVWPASTLWHRHGACSRRRPPGASQTPLWRICSTAPGVTVQTSTPRVHPLAEEIGQVPQDLAPFRESHAPVPSGATHHTVPLTLIHVPVLQGKTIWWRARYLVGHTHGPDAWEAVRTLQRQSVQMHMSPSFGNIRTAPLSQHLHSVTPCCLPRVARR